MKINQQQLTMHGPAGMLEAVLLTPKEFDKPPTIISVFCHPHPLKEGTMHNKVVTTSARAFASSGIPTLIFNFRGVGNSEGKYDYAKGEVDDCLAAVDYISRQYPDARLWLGGFSFGSFVALCAHSKVKTENLILIAPPVPNFDFNSQSLAAPLLVIQGEQDEVIAPDTVFKWYNSIEDSVKNLIKVDTGHFFHGKLVELKGLLESEVNTKCSI